MRLCLFLTLGVSVFALLSAIPPLMAFCDDGSSPPFPLPISMRLTGSFSTSYAVSMTVFFSVRLSLLPGNPGILFYFIFSKEIKPLKRVHTELQLKKNKQKNYIPVVMGSFKTPLAPGTSPGVSATPGVGCCCSCVPRDPRGFWPGTLTVTYCNEISLPCESSM